MLYSYNNIDTYRFAHLKVAGTTVTTGSSANVTWIVVGIGGAIVLLGVVWLVRRRGRRRETE